MQTSFTSFFSLWKVSSPISSLRACNIHMKSDEIHLVQLNSNSNSLIKPEFLQQMQRYIQITLEYLPWNIDSWKPYMAAPGFVLAHSCIYSEQFSLTHYLFAIQRSAQMKRWTFFNNLILYVHCLGFY